MIRKENIRKQECVPSTRMPQSQSFAITVDRESGMN